MLSQRLCIDIPQTPQNPVAVRLCGTMFPAFRRPAAKDRNRLSFKEAVSELLKRP
jgi:hypothetical protein